MSTHAPPGAYQPAWEQISTSLLEAELSRRQDDPQKPACGSGSKGVYNTPLHVIALFLILALSTLACSFPIIVRRFPRLPVPHHFLFLSRHFGTGVLIATAFVHLLPTAFISLTDPCLPSFWNDGYPAMAGLIAMISVLTVVGIEMFFATRGAGHMHGSDYDNLAEPEDAPRIHNHPAKRPQHRRQASLRPFQQVPIGEEPRQRDIVLGDMNASSEHLIASHSPLPGSPEHGKNYFDAEEDSEPDLDLDELDPASEGTRRRQSNGFAKSPPRREGHETFSDEEYDPAAEGMSPGLSEQQEQKKMLLQCLLLEAGILFHSVFIGMALSVATGTPFIVLLVAISFHQTFEGLALGSRIAAVTAFGPTSAKPWLMALAYGTTTPIGQAIGLLVHNMYDPASQTGLLMVGVMNAISSGLLLFAGLVELLAEDFLSDKSYEDLVGRKRVEACGAVVGGSLLMAIVGAWA